MQASLFNTLVFQTNSSDIPPHCDAPSIQEPISSQVDLDMQALDMPNFSSHGMPLHVINTAFDHNHTFNKKLGFPPKNKRMRYRYTQKERRSAEHAQRCISLEDFREQVSIFIIICMNSFKRLSTRLPLNYPLVQNLTKINISN